MFKDWGGCVVEGVATLRCLPVVFGNVVTAALMFVGITALFFLIYGGFKYINSGGDAKQVASARATITYAIIGVVIVLMSFSVIYFISYATGAECIKNFDFNCK